MYVVALVAALTMIQSAPVDRPPIVVTSPPPPSDRQARDFVQDITPLSYDQVARYHTPVCPLVLGLEAKSARVVQQRIRETATGVGAQVDPTERCAANLLVVVANDGREFVKALRHNMPSWLTGLNVMQVESILTQPGAARVWSVVTIRNEDGLTGETTAHAPRFRPMKGAPWMIGGRFPEDAPTMRVRTSSMIKQAVRADIEGSVIVIDRSAALGATLAQLADYAAMRGLARTAAPKSTGVKSILSLFEPAGPREAELTRSDILYLQTLYRSAGTEGGTRERASLSRAIRKDGRKKQ